MKGHQEHETAGPYRKLVLELSIDFLVMYFVMFTMIATLRHFHHNINTVYMTLMMVTPMALVMLIGMGSMFPSRALNLAIGAGAVLVFVASFFAMRSQAAVGDEQFLRSMIPHHSGAILMCEQATLTDPEITSLCVEIVESQKAEIARMEAMLTRY